MGKLESSCPPDLHLLGETAYPLHPWVLTPYRENGHLSPVQHRYNNVHSSARSCVERAFGLLKGKFCRLKGLDMDNLMLINEVIVAACVVHSHIIRTDGVDKDAIELDDNDDTKEDANPAASGAFHKRDWITPNWKYNAFISN